MKSIIKIIAFLIAIEMSGIILGYFLLKELHNEHEDEANNIDDKYNELCPNEEYL